MKQILQKMSIKLNKVWNNLKKKLIKVKVRETSQLKNKIKLIKKI